ncbi:hypothetical protein [Brevundimonas sp. UBA2416]|uniref:hypothetical protein n=1 Tax=Brevundimonas sp. UBA2416 TaxID=1946124 RepID=UPI0025C1F8A3|nr:hypothetical protein [Brevundimonas sp. UBA2416]HRJ64584.1 hypothetical protein [Brevundimonas sp.]
MRAPVLIVLSGLLLGASACATVEAPVEPAPAVASSGPPTPIADHDWFYHRDGEEARLVYGLAESDDLRLGLDCRQGSGRLALSAVGGPDAKPEIYIEAGGETERFMAQSEPSELHEGVFLTAEADADAPVFQRFRRIGWLALWVDGERQAYAPHPESAPNIERFFVFCG